jgi:hypothetical protein
MDFFIGFNVVSLDILKKVGQEATLKPMKKGAESKPFYTQILSQLGYNSATPS